MTKYASPYCHFNIFNQEKGNIKLQQKFKGFTLLELLIAIVILGILATIGTQMYQSYIRSARITEVRSMMMRNAHALEKHYMRHHSFKQNSTTWAALPETQTDTFCIRMQGQARGADDDKFTIKAVAFDKEQEPRVFKLNHNLRFFVCETSKSRCDVQPKKGKDNIFSGTDDKKCRPYS